MYHYRITGLSIYDGDSFRADIDLGLFTWLRRQAFRLFGVDAPELRGQTIVAGRLARDEFIRLTAGHEYLWVRTFRDNKEKYGRWLALVFTDQADVDEATSINRQLLQSGFGYVPMLY